MSTPPFLRRGQYIRIIKTLIAEDGFAYMMRDGAFEYWAVVDKRMELAVLAARIDFGRQA